MNVTDFERKIMGLAAGQARLLTITGRKSDCEFESMRLSHQKIALARQLADLSNEYQNSLNQTKLIYDYYGTGDTSTPLSYNILMQPSALNNYMPTTLTDSMGRVCLNSKLASVAFAAGIPQEGLGTLPSEVMRNNFIMALADVGLITQNLANTITSLPYNQQAGFGGGEVVITQLKEVSYSDLLTDYFSNVGMEDVFTQFLGNGKEYGWSGEGFTNLNNQQYAISDRANIKLELHNMSNSNEKRLDNASDIPTLDKLLNGNGEEHYVLWASGHDGAHKWEAYHNMLADYDGIWAPMIDKITEVLDNGTVAAQKAIEFAVKQFKDHVLGGQCDPNIECNQISTFEQLQKAGYVSGHRKKSQGKINSWENGNLRTKNGISIEGNSGGKYNTAAGVDITNCLQQFMTYFVMLYKGIENNTLPDGTQKYVVGDCTTEKSINRLIQEDEILELANGSEVSSNDLGQATFYDALFNQICHNGWTENNKINDNEYLQKMLQTGMLYVSRLKDDGYYYQGDYATDTYIKEIPDETLIANAEAKYQTEKAKLNAKEETLDMKMKNLDTEISALTTEYDTVKNTISKQIEKSFKRYNA